jgi:hypothetical protein
MEAQFQKAELSAIQEAGPFIEFMGVLVMCVWTPCILVFYTKNYAMCVVWLSGGVLVITNYFSYMLLVITNSAKRPACTQHTHVLTCMYTYVLASSHALSKSTYNLFIYILTSWLYK